MGLMKYCFVVFSILIGINAGSVVSASQVEKESTADSAKTQEKIIHELIFNEQETTEGSDTGQDLPKEILVEKDSSVMMLIPAGPFWMGMQEGTTHHDAPFHKVFIDDFYIDKCEVTNKQYEQFIKETGHTPSWFLQDPRFNDPMFPVVGVNWQDAADYAKWAGKRLPTEAEWEKAARGGLKIKRFPWGDKLSKEYANYHSMISKPVASYSPNGYGLFDMAGNVWEWVSDFYSPNYYGLSPLTNPQGPETGRFRVQRGGSFITSGQSLMCGHRHSYDPELSMYFIGFRCVKDVE